VTSVAGFAADEQMARQFAVALALWKLRLLVALVFAGFIAAAAMRPGIDALHRRRVPRAVGLILHYALFGR
jgi:predicted PurR-regulated permease PerM